VSVLVVGKHSVGILSSCEGSGRGQLRPRLSRWSRPCPVPGPLPFARCAAQDDQRYSPVQKKLGPANLCLDALRESPT
jgi:hypothetical protein